MLQLPWKGTPRAFVIPLRQAEQHLSLALYSRLEIEHLLPCGTSGDRFTPISASAAIRGKALGRWLQVISGTRASLAGSDELSRRYPDPMAPKVQVIGGGCRVPLSDVALRSPGGRRPGSVTEASAGGKQEELVPNR